MEEKKVAKGPEHQINREQLPDCSAEKFSQVQSQRKLDIRAFIRPIQQQADILQYFHYWRERIVDNMQIYSCLLVQQRHDIKQKLYICQRYSKLYFQPFIAVWYSYLIGYINKEFPQQPFICIAQEKIQVILAKIYDTHKEPLWPLYLREQPTVDQPKPKESKTFIGSIVTTIFDFFFQKERNINEPEEERLIQEN